MRAYFMIGENQIAGEVGPVVFLGLSCEDSAMKGLGIGKRLYSEFLHDAGRQVDATRIPVCFWFHTATPAVCSAFWSLWPKISPSAEGVFGSDNLGLLAKICDHFGMSKYQDNEHPFVLRKYAKARYSDVEVDRLSGRDQGLIAALDINEKEGDRLLFLGVVPVES